MCFDTAAAEPAAKQRDASETESLRPRKRAALESAGRPAAAGESAGRPAAAGEFAGRPAAAGSAGQPRASTSAASARPRAAASTAQLRERMRVPPFLTSWGTGAAVVRESHYKADPIYKLAMQRVTRRVEVIEKDWKELGKTPEGLKERAEKYPDLEQITGPRRELLLSTAEQRRRCGCCALLRARCSVQGRCSACPTLAQVLSRRGPRCARARA